jgi:hypothetical protein
MREYKDNLIGRDGVDGLDLKIRQKYKKAPNWIPFETYDLIQCGYPYVDHGEMIIRVDGGTNEKNELLPATGMWCKVEEVLKYIETLHK